MDIIAGGGEKIHIMPTGARCALTGESPEKMSGCPIYNFDDVGELCVPELCDEYYEEG